MSPNELAESQPAPTEADPHTPDFYFNGFTVNVGTGDVTIVLQKRNEPVAVLQTSFTVAKSLAEGLGFVIAELEKATGNEIMTTSFVETKLQEAFGARSSSKV